MHTGHHIPLKALSLPACMLAALYMQVRLSLHDITHSFGLLN